jgi:hypothetical protein
MTTIGPDRDERLDRALGQWADVARLPVARATEMLASIMATPAPSIPRPVVVLGQALPRSWWREHSAGLAATLVSSAKGLPAVA